jgi:hypothetical protein
MGTFTGAAIVNYRLPFTDQGRQTSVFRFLLQQTNGTLPFLFSISSVFVYMYVCVQIYLYYMLPFQLENGSPGDFP